MKRGCVPEGLSFRDRVMGCWLGKAIGGTLGMPTEGQDGPFNFTFYDPVPTEMVANDDLDLQILWACLLAKQKDPIVSRTLFAKAWKENIGFPWDEYGVCIRNLREGIEPPLSGSFDNWFTQGMGAVIRSEIWACLAPGQPALAAAYAFEDACLDHAGEGLWAEVFLAALQSAAFVESDLSVILQTGFDSIPPDAEIRKALEDTRRWWNQLRDWKAVRLKILEAYGHENFTNVTENVCFMLLALLDGDGDFSRSICTATNCGKDTDCTAASVGALLGILNPAGIDERWLKPIGRSLVLSPPIVGIQPPATLDGFTDLVLDLHARMDGRPPAPAPEVHLPERSPLAARIGFGDVPWFGQGWQPHVPMRLNLPELRPFPLAGTMGSFPREKFENRALFLEIPFELQHPAQARVFFNTHANCRVFLDGTFVFGREGGRMAPSAHRVPLHQYTDTALTAGRHTLVAVLERPTKAAVADWVVGVADLANNKQWIPNIWVRHAEA
ncbi:MAG: ADP-ribosylglycohydrolase family protein [Kiritimatiellia bacterium]|nr:ADP-ribosylglycohydrolase family protein [Kiritimatiellia bacterium]